MIAPPKDITPERLWRTLIQRQRASWPLRFRVRGAESLSLSVVALRGLEAAEALDVLGEDPSRVASDKMGGLIAACVAVHGKPAFRSSADVGMLDETEVRTLGVEVYETLARISPVMHVIDLPAWQRALKDGAMHVGNMLTSVRVAACVDIVGGFQKVVRVARPDRWFGMPIADLTDGQLLAYDAARAAFEKE